MRENRSSGSEGGVALIPPSLPLSRAGAQSSALRRAPNGQFLTAALGSGGPPEPTGQRPVLPGALPERELAIGQRAGAMSARRITNPRHGRLSVQCY